MPIFEYICRSCGHAFEALVQGGRTPACPACSGEALDKQLSVFAVSAARSSTAEGIAPCGRCGDPRGPGSCASD